MLKSNIGPGGSDGKRIYLRYRRPGFNPWVGKIPWRREWQPTLVLLFSNTELTCNLLKQWLFIHHYLIYLKIRKWLVFLLTPHSPLPNHYNLPLKKKKKSYSSEAHAFLLYHILPFFIDIHQLSGHPINLEPWLQGGLTYSILNLSSFQKIFLEFSREELQKN